MHEVHTLSLKTPPLLYCVHYVHIRPSSLYTGLLPNISYKWRRQSFQQLKHPVILVSNQLVWICFIFLGAKLKFEPVELNTVSSYTLSSKQFSVTNIVSFVEVTATPAQVTIADGSRFGIRSPIDFFYPFIWATSGGNAVHVSYAITFSSLIMSVCLGIGRFVWHF